MEEYKAPTKEYCKQSSKCKDNKCPYAHSRDDYFQYRWLKDIKNLFTQRRFEILCRFNCPDSVKVRNIIKTFREKYVFNFLPIINFAVFLRSFEENFHLTTKVLPIDTDEEDSEIYYKILSYVLTRIYILYFRDDINDYDIFQNVMKYLEMTLTDDLPSEPIMALMLHISRSFIGSNSNAFSEGINMFIVSSKEILLTENKEVLEICEEAKKTLSEKIILTKTFERGIKKFLVSIRRSESDFERAVEIIQGLQIVLVQGADFNGMCGMKNVVYVTPEKVFFPIEPTDKKAKIARILILLIHEGAQHIVRGLGNTFETTTPRSGPDWQQLEAGYRLEYCIFGDIFRCQYWQAPENILDPSHWNANSTVIFSTDDAGRIRKFPRNVRNEQQLGIDAENGPGCDL